METFESGAKRSGLKPRYDLIQREFLEGVARVLTKGASAYGESNWMLGDKKFAQDALNHAVEHIYRDIEGDTTEEHLFHAACNLMFSVYFKKRHPEWYDRTATSKTA